MHAFGLHLVNLVAYTNKGGGDCRWTMGNFGNSFMDLTNKFQHCDQPGFPLKFLPIFKALHIHIPEIARFHSFLKNHIVYFECHIRMYCISVMSKVLGLVKASNPKLGQHLPDPPCMSSI